MRPIFLLISLLFVTAGFSQDKKAPAKARMRYEFTRNLPIYTDSIVADMKFPLAWGNSDIKDFNEWKKVARQKVLDCMLMPPPPAGDLNVKMLREEQRDGYKVRKIEIQLSRYYKVPALVLIPDGKGPFPAVNCLHDHGSHFYIGKEKLVRPFTTSLPGSDSLTIREDTMVLADADDWVARNYGGQYFGDYLAKNGFVVFCADAPMWGERAQKEGEIRYKFDKIAGNMMQFGIDLASYIVYDDIAGTDYLATMPEVDPERIGCVGHSLGGYRSWMLSALSDKIKAGVAVCWMVTTDEHLTFRYKRTDNGGFGNCIPGIYRWLDYPHIASLACPKAMKFINGDKDKLFPPAGVNKAYKIMHDVWDSQNAENNLETELLKMDHSCGPVVQKKVLDFLKKHL